MAKKRRGRGEGGLEELESGKWRATRSAGFDDQGNPVRERKVLDSKQAAIDWLHEALSARRGEWAGKTLSSWLDFWLEAKRETVEPATLHWYKQRADRRIRPSLGGVRLNELSAVKVQHWMADMFKAGASVRERYTSLKTLRQALQEAVRMGQLSRNVATAVKLPKMKQSPMVCLNADQAVRLLNECRSDRFAAFYDLALDSGMRPGELFALHWPCVDLRQGCVTVERSLENVAGKTRLKPPKTDRKRVISLAPRTVESLKRHHAAMAQEQWDVLTGPVFVGIRGALIDPKRFAMESFKPLIQRAELPAIRLYDLRHTSATLLLSKDVNVKVVSERLGHSDIATTLRHYAHALPCMQERAVLAVQNLFGELPIDNPSIA